MAGTTLGANTLTFADGEAPNLVLSYASGHLSLGSSKIKEVSDPTADQDVATKAYVDAQSSGSGATSLNGLSDSLIEDSSLYVGHDPSEQTSTAQYNAAVGVTALNSVTEGDHNLAVGYSALTKMTTGSNNVAMGSQTCTEMTTQIRCIGIGMSALRMNEASDNIAIGCVAIGNMNKTPTGSYNCALGNSSLTLLTTGQYNTAVGHDSGDSITTGSQCTLVGRATDTSAPDSVNETVVGHAAVGHGDNTVTLGGSSVTSVYLGDDRTTATAYASAFATPSDSTLKSDIVEIEDAVSKVQKIRGVDFVWKATGKSDTGVIAQEVEQVLPNVVIENAKGIKTVDYGRITALLIQAVKEQQDQIDELKAIIAKQ